MKFTIEQLAQLNKSVANFTVPTEPAQPVAVPEQHFFAAERCTTTMPPETSASVVNMLEAERSNTLGDILARKILRR